MHGQARGVSQEHAKRHFVAAEIFFGVGDKFGNDGGDRGFEVEEAALIQEHGRGGGGDNFGEGG